MTRLLYEKPAALCDLRTDAHGVIEASAGTGKTYTLQHLVVELLLQDAGIRLDEILLVTFTVAATSDLKQKIRQTLEELVTGWERARARGHGSALLVDGQVRPFAEDEAPQTHWVIDLEGIQRLRHALRNFDRAAIYTIHGFCQRILVEYAFANRRLFEQEHVSEEDVIEEAFARMLREDLRPGTEEEVWLRAYLKAGKTVEALRDALAHYVRCSARYEPSFSAPSFRQALDHFARKIEEVGFEGWKEKMSGNSRTLSTMTEKHGPALYEALRQRDEMSLPDLLIRLSTGDAKKGLKYFRNASPQRALSGGQDPVSQALLEILDGLVSLDVAVVNVFGERLRRRVVDLKRDEGYFTFDDMVRVVRDTLVSEGQGGHLVEAIRDQFRYALIDEFQDTDRDQWEIFSRVFVDSPARDRHFLYLIGDPKQAIYGFRGGDVYTYIEACDQLSELGAKNTSLRHNYRSTPVVVQACNAVFADGAKEAIDLGERINYEEEGVLAGRPWLGLKGPKSNVAKGITAFELKTGRDKIGVGAIRRGLIEGYADEIEAVVNGRRNWRFPVDAEGTEHKEVGAEEIYVLCRRRSDLHRMANALRSRGVAFAFLKMPKLFQTEEARDIYELLLAIDDPWNRSRRARAWMTPFFDLRLGDLEGLSQLEERERCVELLLRWSRLARRAEFTRLFSAVVEDSGLIRRRLLLEQGERELTNYLHIFEILADEAARGVQTVQELAARQKAFIDGRQAPRGEEADQQRLETDEEAVQLLTIHASKGLERGLVFIVPGFSGPSKRAPLRFHRGLDGGAQRVEWHDYFGRMSSKDKERYVGQSTAEELRLAYVAMSRASLMAFIPYAEEGTLIRDKIDADPFSQVMGRLERLREEEEANFVEFRPLSIDVEAKTSDPDRLLASLKGVDLMDAKTTPSMSAEQERAETELRAELLRRRWEVTSYSKLKSRKRIVRPEDEKGDDDEEVGRLPGGMATGNFLHLVLEELDYRRVDECTRKQWLEDEEVRRFFEARARRFGRFGDEAVGEAMAIVYDTLHAAVELPTGDIIDGLCTLDKERIRREVEFLFPVPEARCDGQTERVFRSGARIRGGFVTGIVDLIFEYDGLLYFADWKSDRARPFDVPALQQMVEQRYAEQAGLYSLAICRMLGIEDEEDYGEHFGGYYYFFLRGMSPDHRGRGIYGGKVPWKKLLAYEEQLFDVVERAKTATIGFT